MAGYQILRYRPEHRGEVLKLQTVLWSGNLSLNDAYFRWKYETNPYDTEVEVYLAAHQGRIVGVRGFAGSAWEAGVPRRQFPVVCADDLVIEPAHRDRGVFTALMRTALADITARRPAVGLALSLSGGPVTVVGQLAMGWESLGSLVPVALCSKKYLRLRRWSDRLSRLRLLWRLAGTRWANPQGRFDHLDAHAARGRLGGIRIARVAEATAMAEFVNGLGDDGRVRQVRSAQYFEWRFRNPLREYRFLYAGSPRVEGYLVLSRSRSDREQNPPIRIADWEASTEEVARGLLDAALTGEFPLLAAWSMALPHAMGSILNQKGFLPAEQARTDRGARCALVCPLRDGAAGTEGPLLGREISEPANWDLRMLYGMVG